MPVSREEPCFTVALYGTALAQGDILALAGEVVELCRATGQPPTHLTVTARGFGEKPLLFARAWKRLHRAAPETLRSVELYSLVEDWNTLSGWTATCAIDQDDDYFLLGAGLSTMPDAEQRIVALARRWLDRIRPAYGIGFFREHGRGPDGYVIGLECGLDVYSGPEYEEAGATNRWMDGMDEAVYDRGILRDVYPHSLLTSRHLDRDVDGRSLRAWIAAEPWRGRIARCRDGYALWTVEQKHLAAVRYQLAAAGALYVLDRDNHL